MFSQVDVITPPVNANSAALCSMTDGTQEIYPMVGANDSRRAVNSVSSTT